MLPGASRLYGDFLNGNGTIAGYLGPAFDDLAALSTLARELKETDRPREQLVLALSEFAAEAGAPEAAKSQLALLRRPGSLVVLTGQQPGLFTGPLYAIYKALTAERWATQLASLLATPIVPCYWLACDDHDVAEIDHADMPCRDRVATIRYPCAATAAGVPVERIVLDSRIEEVIGELAACLPQCEFAAPAFATLKECYRPGTSFSSAFARLWYRMFPDSKLLFVSPAHPQLRAVAAPLLQQAIRADERLFSIYAETSTRLEAEGYHRQVHKKPTQTFLFYQRDKRWGIHRDSGSGSSSSSSGGGGRSDVGSGSGSSGSFTWNNGERMATEALCESIEQQPGHFSPNVLLRPVVQNAMFPTVGVVLGPGETAYYAQLGGLHDHFGVPRPAIMPRTSVTLCEENLLMRVRQLGIHLAALRENPDHEVARALEARFPQHLGASLEAAASKVDSAFDELSAEVLELDPSLAGTVQAARQRAQNQMRRLSAKTRAAHRRRERETANQIRSMALRLFPRGKAQERTTNILYYWARYGPSFLHQLYRQWPAGKRDHLIWEFS